MQNKMKLFLMMVIVFGGGFLMTEQVLAAPCTCGSSGPFASKPTTGLCTTGNNTSVTGAGPWQWSCDATGVCESVNCSAAKSGSATLCVCGSSGPFTSKPTTNLCSTGTNTSVTGTGPWTWSCALTGTCDSVSCSATKSGTSRGDLDIPDVGLPANPDLVKGILTNVVDWLLSIVGIIAIIGFIISGFQYFLVATDEKMVEKAKKTMVASIIGLVVALSGFIAIKTVDFLLR